MEKHISIGGIDNFEQNFLKCFDVFLSIDNPHT